ncbi:MAG TPA: asparagine synthase-related protein [Thermoplasmataceae archaeon]|nr:asparagine synthase [Thermoplasmatales archaeon AK]HLH85703.1 asparagine synthase-related protein [Thermoplasmataceae archaeon]
MQESDIQIVARNVLETLESYFRANNLSGSALAFSGGLDSTLLLKLSNLTLRPYTVGVKGSVDIKNAEEAADILQVNARIVVIDDDDIRNYAGIVKKIDPDIGINDLGYETVFAAVLDNIDERRLVTGQGSDEIFYGYRKFSDGRESSNFSSLEKLSRVTLPRERRIAEYFGKEVRMPYLEAGIQNLPAAMSREMNLREGGNKVILREAATMAGLPPELVRRAKKAAQYGSGVMKVIRRLEL